MLERVGETTLRGKSNMPTNDVLETYFRMQSQRQSSVDRAHAML